MNKLAEEYILIARGTSRDNFALRIGEQMRRKYSKDVYDWFKSFAESLTNDFARQAEIVEDMQEALDEDFPVKRKTYRHRSARDILYIFICRYAWDTQYEHIGMSLVPPITAKNTNYYCNWAESYFLNEKGLERK